MKNFNSLYSILIESLLLEAIGKTDIVDLYLILSMPNMADQANNFVAQEVVKETSGRIIAESEHVVLRELRHIYSQSSIGGVSDAYKQLKQLLDTNMDVPKDRVIGAVGLWPARAAVEAGLPSLEANEITSKDVLRQWYNFSLGLHKAIIYLRNKAKIKGYEMSLTEMNKASGYNFTFAFIARLFENGDWEEAYGGDAWAYVARAVDDLKTASRGKFIFYLDRLVDLVHNNGTVLNKFKAYKQGWLTYILDLKQHAININELIPYASKEVQRLFRTPEWRQNKMAMPGGNETSGVERVISKTLDFWAQKNGSWYSPPFGEIMDLIRNVRYGLFEGLRNLYKTSNSSYRQKLRKTIKAMIVNILRNHEGLSVKNNVNLFDDPTDKQLLRFASAGDTFHHCEGEKDVISLHGFHPVMPKPVQIQNARLLINFLYNASEAIGLDLVRIIDDEKKRQKDNEKKQTQKHWQY